MTRTSRWRAKLIFVLLNTALLRMALPAYAVGMAVTSAEQGWGLLNHLALPLWLAVPLAVVVSLMRTRFSGYVKSFAGTVADLRHR